MFARVSQIWTCVLLSNQDTKRWYRLPKLLHNSPAETKQDCGASSRERVRRLKFGFLNIKKKVTSIIGDVVKGFPSVLVASVFNTLNDLKTDLDCGNSHVIHLYRRACVRGLVHRGKRTMTRRGNKRGMSRMHRLVLCQFPFNQQEFTPSKSFFWVGNTTIVITDGRWIALMLWLWEEASIFFVSFQIGFGRISEFQLTRRMFWTGNSKMRNLEGSIYQRCGFISPFVWMKCTRSNSSYRIHVE